MDRRGRKNYAIYGVLDGDKNVVFEGGLSDIASEFNIDRSCVYRAYKRGSKFKSFYYIALKSNDGYFIDNVNNFNIQKNSIRSNRKQIVLSLDTKKDKKLIDRFNEEKDKTEFVRMLYKWYCTRY